MSLSDADPAYPPNHVFDGKTEPRGQVSNADFDAASFDVPATPPANHDLQAVPITQAAFPNGNFSTGTFASWTTAGTPTIRTSADRRPWAELDARRDVITTSALTIPADAQSLSYDIGYLTTSSTSWVRVYVLSGANYATSTLIKEDSCSSCGYWSTTYLDIRAYRSQSIKVKFLRYFGTNGIDNVEIRQPFPSFEITGEQQRLTSAGDTYANVKSGSLTSPAVAVDAATQFGVVQLRAGNRPYEIAVAPGPAFSTFTVLATGASPAAWEDVRFHLSPGKASKSRFA